MLKRAAIIYDCPYPFVEGGGQKRLYEIAKRLKTLGWEFDWYCLKSWEGPDQVEKNGIRYIAIAPSENLYREDGKRSIGAALRFALKTFKIKKLRQYDVVHIGQWPMLPIVPAFLYTLFSKTKIIVDWWEVWGKNWFGVYGIKGILGFALEWLTIKLPNDIVAISAEGEQKLSNAWTGRAQLHLIHNGVDIQAIRNIPYAHKPIFDVVYLGRLKEHKNVNHIIEAAALLREQGTPIKVAIIGGGPEKSKLELLVAKLGVTQDIKFLGFLETANEAYSVMKSSKCFVHPSTKEGGGSITLFEANACGLPVLAYECEHGIDQTLIENGKNGFWIQGVSSRMLAHKLIEVLPNLDKSCRISAEQFAAQYDWGRIAASYHQLYLK